MGMPEPAPGRPAVSVIVPARNEEDCLGACLQSLVSQNGVDFEILVVDDHSADRTREIAASFPKVRVTDPGPLPSGWSGKNNAVAAGARAARGEWLLFTDADTVHLPGSLARSLAEARQRNVALLSYSPEQDVRTFWEKAIMPVIFAELASTYRPSEVSDRNSPAAAANGQYILVERTAYDAIGGHTAVAHDLLEDVALARAVKQSGRPIFFRQGTGLVRTRMYRSFAQLREGWTKNLVLLFPHPVELAARRAFEFVILVGSFAAVVVAIAMSAAPPWTLIALAIAAVSWTLFLKRVRRAHFSWDSTALAVLGLPLFSWLLLRSKRKHEQGRVPWKGRLYGSAGHTPTANINGPAAPQAVTQRHDLRSVP